MITTYSCAHALNGLACHVCVTSTTGSLHATPCSGEALTSPACHTLLGRGAHVACVPRPARARRSSRLRTTRAAMPGLFAHALALSIRRKYMVIMVRSAHIISTNTAQCVVDVHASPFDSHARAHIIKESHAHQPRARAASTSSAAARTKDAAAAAAGYDRKFRGDRRACGHSLRVVAAGTGWRVRRRRECRLLPQQPGVPVQYRHKHKALYTVGVVLFRSQ